MGLHWKKSAEAGNLSKCDNCFCCVCDKTLTELFLKRPKVRLSAASCVSGVVVQVGSRVTRCSPGDRVAGSIPSLLIYYLDC